MLMFSNTVLLAQTRPDQGLTNAWTANALEKYLLGSATNAIRFSISFPHQYTSTNVLSVQLPVVSGVPSQMAVLIDSTNYGSAIWKHFNSNLGGAARYI